MDGRKDQFDGPFGGQPFGLKWIGKPKAANRQVSTGGPRPVELFFDVLSFADHRALGQKIKVRADDGVMDLGATDFDRGHATFPRQEAGQWNFELAVGEEEDRFAIQMF